MYKKLKKVSLVFFPFLSSFSKLEQNNFIGNKILNFQKSAFNFFFYQNFYIFIKRKI